MWKCGVFSGLMVAIGYPGEVGNDAVARWGYCATALCPFMYVLYELYFITIGYFVADDLRQSEA